MARKISTEVGGFTPLFDAIVIELGPIAAAVFGARWRFCQMTDGVCKASVETIAKLTGQSDKTVRRHTDDLVKAGYLVDLTPDLRNQPHVYKETGRVKMVSKLSVAYEKPAQVEEKPKRRTAAKVKGDIFDLMKDTHAQVQAATEMRLRAETVLKRTINWDSNTSAWINFDKTLQRMEQDTGFSLDEFMTWHNQDEFRKKNAIYLTPVKIKDWWPTAMAELRGQEEQVLPKVKAPTEEDEYVPYNRAMVQG